MPNNNNINMKLQIADVKLNEGSSFKRMLIITNEHGMLCVDEELYSLSFEPNAPLLTEVNYLKDIDLSVCNGGDFKPDTPFVDIVADSSDMIFRAGYNLAVKLLEKDVKEQSNLTDVGIVTKRFINSYYNNNINQTKEQ